MVGVFMTEAAIESERFRREELILMEKPDGQTAASCGEGNQSRFLGRGCDEALFSENGGFSVKRGEAIQWIGGLVRISTGKAIQWRGSGHSLNRRTLKTEKLLSSSPAQKSAPREEQLKKLTLSPLLGGSSVGGPLRSLNHFRHFSAIFAGSQFSGPFLGGALAHGTEGRRPWTPKFSNSSLP